MFGDRALRAGSARGLRWFRLLGNAPVERQGFAASTIAASVSALGDCGREMLGAILLLMGFVKTPALVAGVESRADMPLRGFVRLRPIGLDPLG
jgi:hypothetical protein